MLWRRTCHRLGPTVYSGIRSTLLKLIKTCQWILKLELEHLSILQFFKSLHPRRSRTRTAPLALGYHAGYFFCFWLHYFSKNQALVSVLYTTTYPSNIWTQNLLFFKFYLPKVRPCIWMSFMYKISSFVLNCCGMLYITL